MPARNLFESATPAAKAGAKKAKKVIPISELQMVASIDVFEKTLDALKEFSVGVVKTQMHQYFVNEGGTRHKRPDNFEGIEGDAEASLQMRKRSSVSKLDANETEMLESFGVPVERIARTFKINPSIAGDAELLAKISAAIVEHVPEVEALTEPLFIEEAAKVIVTDESIDAVFRMNDPESIANLLPIVSTLAIRPKLKDNKPAAIKAAFQRVLNALNLDLDAEPQKKAAALVGTLPTFARKKKNEYTK